MKIQKQKRILMLLIFILALSGFFVVYQSFKKTVYASSRGVASNQILEIKENDEPIDVYEIIQKNIHKDTTEEVVTEEVELEYTTLYQNNDKLGRGTIRVLQEGRNGLQKVTIKNMYEKGELISSKQLDSKVIKSSIQKIVEIGTAQYTSTSKIKIGDVGYITPSTASIRPQPDIEADKLLTLHQNQEVKVLQIQEEWYQISYQNYIGWIEKDCVKSNSPEQDEQEAKNQYSKEQLLARLKKDMNLNKPSGLSLAQFKKILSGNKEDKNKIFEQNASYFYYAEKQYNINGVFLAAVGIHESGWGTSKIARDKKNLFGYGAYDSSAYTSSYTFNSYAEGIDLIARVFTKYYLNTPGTKIYGGEVASGKYYSGSTLSAVNKRYASDSNWANGVYQRMSYLYNKL